MRVCFWIQNMIQNIKSVNGKERKMSAKVLNCKLVAQSIQETCKKEVEQLKKRGITPKLGIIRVGAKGADISYEKGATKTMQEAGIAVEVYALDENISQEEYIAKMQEINADIDIHGILAFRPLDNIDEQAAISDILNPLKDVDSCTVANMGKVMLNDETGLYPCTAEAIMEVIDYYQIDVKGMNIVIVNNSNVIGKPVAMMLTNRFATVTICHEFTKNIQDICLNADMIICAVPVENVVKTSQVKAGAIVIDAAVIRKKAFDVKGTPIINEKTGKQKIQTVGCCEMGVEEVAGMKTPVPGIGAITSALLAKNLVKACKLLEGYQYS